MVFQVRNNVAYTIATIGHWDWPEQWPALFDLMMAALQDSNEFAVQVHAVCFMRDTRETGSH